MLAVPVTKVLRAYRAEKADKVVLAEDSYLAGCRIFILLTIAGVTGTWRLLRRFVTRSVMRPATRIIVWSAMRLAARIIAGSKWWLTGRLAAWSTGRFIRRPAAGYTWRLAGCRRGTWIGIECSLNFLCLYHANHHIKLLLFLR